MNRALILTVLVGAVFLVGCGSRHRLKGDPSDFVKPTIAVMKFENRAPFPLGWKLGDGMSDILVDRLLATKRYHVIERLELNSILRELRLQTSGVTRRRGRAELGRIKNVQYLIKGTVTDFGHVARASGWFGTSWFRLFGSSAMAVMGMTFYVVDVESGEIICSRKIEESVHASDLAVKGRYKGVAMGGSVFYQTPLGKATANVMDRAVRQITNAIASRRWQPRIAALEADGSILLNGGTNREIQVGQEYEVLKAGSPIVDPETGDAIGWRKSKVLTLLRVVKVHDRYCVTERIEDDSDQPQKIRIGLSCRLVPPPKEPQTP